MKELHLTLFNKKCTKEKLASLTLFILIMDAVTVLALICDDRSRVTYGDIISIVVITLLNVCILVADIYVVVEALLSQKSDDVSLCSMCSTTVKRFDDWKWNQKWRHFILRDHRDMKGMIGIAGYEQSV